FFSSNYVFLTVSWKESNECSGILISRAALNRNLLNFPNELVSKPSLFISKFWHSEEWFGKAHK
ncbi:hypothetical protein PMAYCL1PPCAC_13816, partial [Pristionchus mayeri]